MIFKLRMVLMALWVALASMAGLFVCVVLYGSLNLNRIVGRMLAVGVLAIGGLKVELEGAEHLEAHQPCVYLANHQHNMDVVNFGRIYPHWAVGLGKKEIKWVPFFGFLFYAAGNITIDRSDRSKAMANLMEGARKARKKGGSIWIFPEGTRNKTGRGLLPLKKGAFFIAIDGQLPIVPLVCEPLGQVIDFTNGRFLKRVVRIRVLPPTPTIGLTEADLQPLIDEVHARMLAAINDLTVASHQLG